MPIFRTETTFGGRLEGNTYIGELTRLTKPRKLEHTNAGKTSSSCANI